MSNTFTIDGKKYEYPDWTLGVVKKITPLFDTIRNGVDVETSMTTHAEIIAIIMQRKYPELTSEYILDNLTFDEFKILEELAIQQFDIINSKKKSQET